MSGPRLLVDCETDNLLADLTKLHCLVAKDIDTGEVHQFNPEQVREGVKFIQSASLIVGHNIISFDYFAIKKVYPWFEFDRSKFVDTLLLSRLIYSDIASVDDKLVASGRLPSKLFKRHSLEAWGHRLGNPKAEYNGGWSFWSQEMQDYCVQDVETLHTLYTKLTSKDYSQRAIDLEHSVQWIVSGAEHKGVLFDTLGASKLCGTLAQRREEIRGGLSKSFPPRYLRDSELTPKRPDAAKGYVSGATLTKIKDTEFNPGSRHHISHWLKAMHGWEPADFTPTGEAKVDETVLLSLPYPEAKLLGEYFLIEKRLGQISEGNQGWLRHVKHGGRIHGSMIINGTITGRASHSHPNMGQVPSCESPYGKECRSLFHVPQGKALVGADLSGLELRMLAHFMSKWDNGAYGKVLLEGDIHTANQDAAGLPTRANAKTFIYGWLYGAGDAKIGSIVGKGAKEGKRLKERFLSKLPALGNLLSAVQKAARERGYIVGLDGRHVPIRSAHSALNTLLQSAGAIVAKQTIVNLQSAIDANHYTERAHIILWVHDEYQIECDKDIANEIGELAVKAMQKTGEELGIRLPVTGEYKIGTTWAETH